MKILIVSNYKDSSLGHFPILRETLSEHEVKIQTYHPGINFEHESADLIILSGGGGEGQEIDDVYRDKLWYDDQMKLVLSTSKPIVGICMGFEVIVKAYGEKVKKLPKAVEGFQKIQITVKGQKLFGVKHLVQDQAHSWGVAKAPKDFHVLAKSDSGIEIIKHKTRPIIATQFHPEKSGTINLKQLLYTI